MPDRTHDTPRRASASLQFLARIGSTRGKNSGLTRAQWETLQYFGTVNRFSRTLSGCAQFHSTSQGSASQTIKSLVKRGLLARVPDENDGRRARFDLTDEARVVCFDGSPDELVRMISLLTVERQDRLQESLQEILSKIHERLQRPVLGNCEDCKFSKQRLDTEKGVAIDFCTRSRSDLDMADMEYECIHHTPNTKAASG